MPFKPLDDWQSSSRMLIHYFLQDLAEILPQYVFESCPEIIDVLKP